MRLPYYFLKENLENSCNFRVFGKPTPETKLPRPRFCLSSTPIEPGKLYISDQAPAANTAENSAVLLVSDQPADLLNRTQDLFDRCELWAESLSAAAETGEMRELLDEIEMILNNPILLHKSNYSIVACSSEVYSNEDLISLRGSHLSYDYVNALKRDPNFDLYRTASSAFFCNCPIASEQALSINLLPDAEISYRLTVIPLLSPLTESSRFLLTLCSGFVTQVLQNTVIARRYDDPTGRRERLMDLYRTGVVNENADLIVLEQGFSALGWLPSHQYCCLSIQIGTPDYVSHTVELLCNQLELLFPASCIFAQLGTIAVLLNLTLAGSTIREILEKSRYFFRDNDLRCGISNVFTGFRELRNYHKQSQIALSFASRPQTHLWTQYFSDVVLDYILEQSNRELPLHLICSQQILLLKQYDTEHQTEFYPTLECYIRNKFNAVQTARELQIHRSTFLYRMERLQSLFDLDLNQRNSLLYILLSMKMLESSKSMTLRE